MSGWAEKESGDDNLIKPVYLDYAATTPLEPEIAQAMLLFMTGCFGNPSSIHSFGRVAREAVAKARKQVAALLQAETDEIFFTSGGSESDNWAIKGIAWKNRSRGNHIITTSIEHHAVLNTCAWLETQGFDVTYLPVDKQGRIAAADVEAAITEKTILISVMAANNEVGTIEPLQEIAAIAHRYGVCFHTDAVQAAAHIPLDVKALGVDALSLSAHKFYGPKGVGVLYLRRGTGLDCLLHGGSQERSMRAGTENTAGILGLGMAAEIAAKNLHTEMVVLSELREQLIEGVLSIDGAWLNGPRRNRLPGNVSFGIAGIASEALLIRLDLAGFAVSSGSACSAGSLEASHVLLAMGQSEKQATAAIRVTLGRYSTHADVEAFLGTLRKIVREIKRIQQEM